VSIHPIIFARGISKRFGNTLALKGVDLIVHSGEVHALLGENGAGKSTLINILAGELQPDSGDVFICGERILSVPILRPPKIFRFIGQPIPMS
jgi:ABC-type sugar transport system ATPase subunit